MAPAKEKPRFFKNIGKAIGIQIVDSPKPQDVMTAPSVNPGAPVLGEVKATQVDFSTPQSLGDKAADTLTSVPLPPAPIVENSMSSVPPVPEVRPIEALSSVTPAPEVVQNAFANAPESALNPAIAPAVEAQAPAPPINEPAPTIVPAERPAEQTVNQDVAPVEPIKTPEDPTLPTVPVAPAEKTQDSVSSEPAVPDAPLVNNPEPTVESQDTIVAPEPVTPEAPLVNNPEPEPVVVSPSMATPEVVPSDHVVENTEIQHEESQSVPDAVENSFSNEPEDHLDPAPGAADEKQKENGEFNVKIDPVVNEIMEKDSDDIIQVGPDKKLFVDMEELQARVFAEKVMKDKSLGNLLKQLEDIGVTPEVARKGILKKLKSLNS